MVTKEEGEDTGAHVGKFFRGELPAPPGLRPLPSEDPHFLLLSMLQVLLAAALNPWPHVCVVRCDVEVQHEQPGPVGQWAE